MDANQTKKCSQCGIFKSLDEYHKRKSQISGLRSECKDCRKKYALFRKKEIAIREKLYRQKNKKAIAAKKKKYNKENTETIKEQRRVYLKENKGIIATKHSIYLKKNRISILIQRKNYYEKNRTELNEKQRKYQRIKREINPDLVNAKKYMNYSGISIKNVPLNLLKYKEKQLLLKRGLKTQKLQHNGQSKP